MQLIQLSVQAENATRAAVDALVRRTRSAERGEGVISAAIAVLIMAVIGAAMYFAYTAMFKDSSDKTKQVLEQITVPTGNP